MLYTFVIKYEYTHVYTRIYIIYDIYILILRRANDFLHQHTSIWPS